MRPDNPNLLAPTVQRDYNYAYFPVLNRFTVVNTFLHAKSETTTICFTHFSKPTVPQ